MYVGIPEVKAVLERRSEDIRWSDNDIENAIELAERVVNAFCGRHFYNEPAHEVHAPITGLICCDVWPIISVSKVVDAETGEDVEFDVLAFSWGHIRVHGDRLIKITYTYNDPDNPVPVPVSKATAEIAANILTLGHEAYEMIRLGDISIQGETAERYIPCTIQEILRDYRRVVRAK